MDYFYRTTENNITALAPNQIFVFGSNGEGYHYSGAARYAHEHFGAVMGRGHGIQGKSYAINTMSGLGIIQHRVWVFINYAKHFPETIFLVTEIGTGIAGYTSEQIAPLFKEAMTIQNIHLPEKFWNILLNS